jgi:hypothetical protein
MVQPISSHDFFLIRLLCTCTFDEGFPGRSRCGQRHHARAKCLVLLWLTSRRPFRSQGLVIREAPSSRFFPDLSPTLAFCTETRPLSLLPPTFVLGHSVFAFILSAI